MRDGGTSGEAHLDALMYRMLGGLLLLGSSVLFGVVAVLLAMPRLETANGAVLVLPGPGGRHVIDVAALPVLGVGALIMGAPGLLALAFARRNARFAIRPPGTALRARAVRRPLLVLCGGVALLALVLLRR